MRGMTWQALLGLSDNARRVMLFKLYIETMVYNVEDDVAGIVCQALPASWCRCAAGWSRSSRTR